VELTVAQVLLEQIDALRSTIERQGETIGLLLEIMRAREGAGRAVPRRAQDREADLDRRDGRAGQKPPSSSGKGNSEGEEDRVAALGPEAADGGAVAVTSAANADPSSGRQSAGIAGGSEDQSAA
jgi:hypothetical protein